MMNNCSLIAAHLKIRNDGRDAMKQPRREFLFFGGVVLSGVMCGVQLDAPGQSRKMPSPPEAAATSPPASGNVGNRASQRALLQQHEKDFRESLAKLSERVQELKAEIEQLHSSDIFSVKIYKQASDIERLAKQLKTLAKG
jgi:hypothetical protein